MRGNIGDVLSLRPDPFEVDAKIFHNWEVYLVDPVDLKKISKGILRTAKNTEPPAVKHWDGVPYRLKMANRQRMQAWYER